MAQTALADPAPALTRGLSLLRRLERDGAASLERLVRDTGWPKSSVARLLQSLEAAGAVARDPATKRYHARVRLVPLDGGHARLVEAWRAVADHVSREAGQTVELHRFEGGRLTMVDRLEPEEALVSAKARIGFQRGFDEIDALTRVVLAFGLPERDWPAGRRWAWRDGKRATVTAARRRALVAQTRDGRVATDLGVNPHGVFRYAAPVVVRERLVGVVAVAQVCLPQTRVPEPRLASLAAAAGAKLTSTLSSSLL